MAQYVADRPEIAETRAEVSVPARDQSCTAWPVRFRADDLRPECF